MMRAENARAVRAQLQILLADVVRAESAAGHGDLTRVRGILSTMDVECRMALVLAREGTDGR